MKTCPICRARTFDDAEVCYGCLHRFDDGAARAAAALEEPAWEPADAVLHPISAPTDMKLQSQASAGGGAQSQALSGEPPYQMSASAQMTSRAQVGARLEPQASADSRPQPRMPSGDASLAGGAFASASVPLAGGVSVPGEAPVSGSASIAGNAPIAGDASIPSDSHSAGGGAPAAGEPPARFSPNSRSNAEGAACGMGSPLAVGSAKRSEGAALHARPAFGALPEEPFDRAGWIVRFELPGIAARASGRAGSGAQQAAGCEAAPSPGGQAGAGPLSLVVSICPLRGEQEGALAPRDPSSSGERPLGADAPAAGADPAAPASGGQGRHAGRIVPLAVAKGARP